MSANSIPAYLVLHEESPDCCVARLRNKAQAIPARDLAIARERMLLAEKGRKVKKTNFDRYLDRQLQDPAFADRFKNAGQAWDVALRIAALREQAGLSQTDLAKLLKTSQQQISRLEFPGYVAAVPRLCPVQIVSTMKSPA